MTQTHRQAGAFRIALEMIALTVVAFVIAILAGIVFIVPMIVLGYGIETTLVLVGGTAAGQLGFLAVALGYLRFRDVPIRIAVPTRSDLGYIIGGTVIALAVALGLSYLLSVLEVLPDAVIEDIALVDPTFLLALAALSVILVAPAEELLFRGVIQGRLRTRLGPVPAIAGASLLFGAMHLANYTGSVLPIIAGALLIAVVGSIFGIVYERTDNLSVPIAVHAIYNVLLLVASYFAFVNM